MRALTPAQIAAHVRAAGFPEELVPTKVAIAMAESSGNPRAHNPNASTGDNSYGLFQINMLGGMGPERRRQFGLQSNEQLFDPAINAQAAKKIFDSQGLNAWSVHKSGAYKQFMPEAQQAARASSSAAPAAPFAGPAGGVGSTPAGASLDNLAAQILSGSGSFRMAGTSSMAPQAAAPVARTPGELAGTMLDASFARAAGRLGGRRMAADSALLPELFKAATGTSPEVVALATGRNEGPLATPASPGSPLALHPGRLGGATTNWKEDSDAEQSGYNIVKPGGVGAPIITPVDLEITGKGFQGEGSGETGRGYGNWLSGKFTGEDGRPYELLLGHLNDYSVKPGARVPAGSVLGTQGVTGRAFGAHVTTHVNALSGGDPWKELNRLTKKWTAPL